VFDHAAEGQSAAMVERINRLLARHRPQAKISPHEDSDWHVHIADGRARSPPSSPPSSPSALMGLARAFLDLGADRFGSGAVPRCRGVFIDTSRNRSQCYRSDRCASRTNIPAHRQRHASVAG
jgi:CGNR zinc finger/Putative stress-induced transcription regulator